MPRLRPKQEALAQAFVATGSVTLAGKQAGYSAQPAASRALARPETKNRVAELQRQRLGNELLPLAGDVLERVMKTGKDSDATAAAKVVYTHASKLGLLDDAAADALSKLANDELIAIRNELRRRAQALEAKAIDGEVQILDDEPSGGAFD